MTFRPLNLTKSGRWLLVAALFLSILPLEAASPPEQPTSAQDLAKEHLKAGRHTNAEKLLKEILHREPNNPDAAESLFLLGQAQIGQKLEDEALSTFSGLVRRHPQTEWAAMAFEEQAQVHIARRNPKAAQQLRDELLASHPNSPITAKVWSGGADTCFEQHDYRKALSIYQAIEKHLPPASLDRLKITRVLVDGEGDPQKILLVAEKALNENDRKLATELYGLLAKSPKASKDIMSIQTKLGWCLLLEGGEENQGRAEQLWRNVIRSTRPSDPWYAESKWHLVQLAAGPENDWKKAVSICEEIIKEQSPSTFPHEQALFAKAWMLTVQDQGKEAVAAFKDLATVYPEKMRQPPIRQHLERAIASAAKTQGGAR